MLKNLIQLAILLIAGILVYNYFLGDADEKAQSKAVFQQTGKTVRSAWDLLKSEKQKFDAGKYDRLLDQLGGAYHEVRDRAKSLDENVLRRLDNLEQRKRDLEQELNGIEREDSLMQTAADSKKLDSNRINAQTERKEQLLKEFDALLNDTEKLLKEAEQQQK
ncbi:MAG: hypothetical protein ACK5SQ_01025 [Chitinophagales bacterium]|jgi:hypothetical protein